MNVNSDVQRLNEPRSQHPANHVHQAAHTLVRIKHGCYRSKHIQIVLISHEVFHSPGMTFSVLLVIVILVDLVEDKWNLVLGRLEEVAVLVSGSLAPFPVSVASLRSLQLVLVQDLGA